jgi:hypothetical protein
MRCGIWSAQLAYALVRRILLRRGGWKSASSGRGPEFCPPWQGGPQGVWSEHARTPCRKRTPRPPCQGGQIVFPCRLSLREKCANSRCSFQPAKGAACGANGMRSEQASLALKAVASSRAPMSSKCISAFMSQRWSWRLEPRYLCARIDVASNRFSSSPRPHFSFDSLQGLLC